MFRNSVVNTYMGLSLFNTLAASFIWGINTLFLLDAGLSNFEAFVANAFFSVGMVIFEVPTGVIADTLGRRVSFLLGCLTLSISTLLYLLLWKNQMGVIPWCAVSLMLGFGFTFFSGAIEAWLVDALNATQFNGSLEDVFSKGQVVNGIAMLTGTLAGGYIAQYTNLGVPYILRVGALVVSFLLGFIFMKDLGFQPRKLNQPLKEMKNVLSNSIEHGFRQESTRWMILSSPFITGVMFYGFYASQPFIVELYGDSKAYGIAGLAAAIVSCAQIVGGILSVKVRKLFKRRSHLLLTSLLISSMSMFLIGYIDQFWEAIVLMSFWAICLSFSLPTRQAFINSCIKSDQRATILSFDGLMGSIGGSVFQPILGKSADIYSYGTSFTIGAVIKLGALPFVFLAGKANPQADKPNNN